MMKHGLDIEWTSGRFDRDCIGTVDQVAGIRECRLMDGRSEGVRAAWMHCGNGLELLVLPDRGLDIAEARYNGRSLCYLSPVPIASPAYYEPAGSEWLRTFHAGMLVTCGLQFSGQPETDIGEPLGLHGRISHIPAQGVYPDVAMHGDGSVSVSITGTMDEVKALVSHVRMQRTLSMESTVASFTCEDVVTNEGNRSVPLMLLYHCNFGYPLVNPHAVVEGSHVSTSAVNAMAACEGEIAACCVCGPPDPLYEERVFRHDWPQSMHRRAIGVLGDGRPDAVDALGVVLSYDGSVLPDLLHWKILQRRAYAVGLEPCTIAPVGRGKLREQGLLPMLEPGESRKFKLVWTITTGASQFRRALAGMQV